LRGIRDGDTAHLRTGGFLDYRLLSPSGPFGGTYDETTGRLYEYYADIDFDDRMTPGGALFAAGWWDDLKSLDLLLGAGAEVDVVADVTPFLASWCWSSWRRGART